MTGRLKVSKSLSFSRTSPCQSREIKPFALNDCPLPGFQISMAHTPPCSAPSEETIDSMTSIPTYAKLCLRIVFRECHLNSIDQFPKQCAMNGCAVCWDIGPLQPPGGQAGLGQPRPQSKILWPGAARYI